MTPAPTTCPPYGLCVPIRLTEVRDGDTVVVSVRGSQYVWPVRLLDCWCNEVHGGSAEEKRLGVAAAEYTRQVLEGADAGDLRLYVPLPEPKSLTRPQDLNLLKLLTTFDRLLGWIYVGPTQTINRMLVKQGLASTTKGGKLGQ